MRRGEILGLKWAQIRNGFIYLQKTKTDEPRQIPINDALESLFRDIRKTQQPGTEHVFTFSLKNKWKGPETTSSLKVINFVAGNPVQGVKSAFKAALTRAGIVNFRFHDLRHTFASHMIMRGASLKEVQEILGHKTMTMTLRYAHLSQEHKKKAVNLLNGLTASALMSKNVKSSDFPACENGEKEKTDRQVIETTNLLQVGG
jgi:integrase